MKFTKKYAYIFVLLVLMFSANSCKKEGNSFHVKQTVNLVSYTANFSDENVDIKDKCATIVLPKETDLSQLFISLSFDKENVQVKIDDQIYTDLSYISVDLSKPKRIYVSEVGSNNTTQYTLRASTFTGLPIIRIKNKNNAPVNSNKEIYTQTTVTFDPNGVVDCDLLIAEGQIKGRGNSTWSDMPKKPYKIKLNQKESVFNHPANKDWVLLANYADKTLLRNYVAFQMGKALNMEFTPFGQFVEVYLNDDYIGNYLLTDQIEVAAGRVEGVSLIQIDKRMVENGTINQFPSFKSSRFAFKIKYPNEPTSKEKKEISDYVNKAEKVLFGTDYKDLENGYHKYFDTESVIQWAIINELFQNPDAKDYSSIYFFQQEHNGPLYMGPIWDFDLGGGNFGYPGSDQRNNPRASWFVFQNAYIARMRTDDNFKNELVEYWNTHKGDIERVIDNIWEYYDDIKLSVDENFKVWPKFKDDKWYTVAKQPDNYPGQLEYLEQYLQQRFVWMDEAINKLK